MQVNTARDLEFRNQRSNFAILCLLGQSLLSKILNLGGFAPYILCAGDGLKFAARVKILPFAMSIKLFLSFYKRRTLRVLAL